MFKTPALHRYVVWNMPASHAVLPVLPPTPAKALEEIIHMNESLPIVQEVLPGVVKPPIAIKPKKDGREFVKMLTTAPMPSVKLAKPSQAAESTMEKKEKASNCLKEGEVSAPTVATTAPSAPLSATIAEQLYESEFTNAQKNELLVANPVDDNAEDECTSDEEDNITSDEIQAITTPLEVSPPLSPSREAHEEPQQLDIVAPQPEIIAQPEQIDEPAQPELIDEPAQPEPIDEPAQPESIDEPTQPELICEPEPVAQPEPEPIAQDAAAVAQVNEVASPVAKSSIAGSSTASEDGEDEVLSITIKNPVAIEPVPEPVATHPSTFVSDLTSEFDDGEDVWTVYTSSECTEPEPADSIHSHEYRRSRRRRRLVEPERQPCLRRSNRSSLPRMEAHARYESPARPRGDVTTRLYNPSYHQERDQKLAELRAQREMEQCSFHPATNVKPPAPPSRRRPHRMSI